MLPRVEYSVSVPVPVDAAFQLSIDSWNGNDRLQLKLKDVRSA